MLRPSMKQIIKNDQSSYQVVVAVAKRARDIATNSELGYTDLKPVKQAVEEFAGGKCRFTYTPPIEIEPVITSYQSDLLDSDDEE